MNLPSNIGFKKICFVPAKYFYSASGKRCIVIAFNKPCAQSNFLVCFAPYFPYKTLFYNSSPRYEGPVLSWGLPEGKVPGGTEARIVIITINWRDGRHSDQLMEIIII